MAVVIIGPWDQTEEDFFCDPWGNQVYEWAISGWDEDMDADDTEEPPYDDAKDHEACPSCNKNGKNPNAGWYTPLVGPRIVCDNCDGSGWV